MNQAVLDALASGISSLPALPNENAATGALAAGLLAAGAKAFWTAKTLWSSLASATCCYTSWKGAKAYDLSWATSCNATSPDHLLQVKLGNKSQEDQEVLLFLGDLAFAALDFSHSTPSIMCAAVIPAGRNATYRNRLSPTTGKQMTLVLDPSAAQRAMVRGSGWIDPCLARICPTTTSQCSKIFGAGTNAKFIGLFQRKGQVTILCDVETLMCGSYKLLVYSVADRPNFMGSGTLEEWRP